MQRNDTRTTTFNRMLIGAALAIGLNATLRKRREDLVANLTDW